jgi:hypothetical protein
MLRSPVAVVGQAALRWPAFVQRLLQGIEDEGGMGCSRHPPADNAAGKDVDDEGDVDDALLEQRPIAWNRCAGPPIGHKLL